jgi:hypothetical protein
MLTEAVDEKTVINSMTAAIYRGSSTKIGPPLAGRHLRRKIKFRVAALRSLNAQHGQHNNVQ